NEHLRASQKCADVADGVADWLNLVAAIGSRFRRSARFGVLTVLSSGMGPPKRKNPAEAGCQGGRMRLLACVRCGEVSRKNPSYRSAARSIFTATALVSGRQWLVRRANDLPNL